MALTTEIFDDVQNFIKDNISAVRYVSSDGGGIAEIKSVTASIDGTIRVEVIIEKSNVKITQMLLYGKNGHIWASQNIDITLGDNASGVIFRFDINIREGSLNV
ncbi:MAG: hypothetical protein E7671_00490 [Ruminococcaceae bacterium]|nr:hypothetical protein [Oscillospiraceae bacterium]